MKTCRYCGEILEDTFVDLGMQPLSNDYLSKDQLDDGQHMLPLKACVCKRCKLVQVVNTQLPENIFNRDYKYFSSYSSSWLKHCEEYVDMIVEKLNLDSDSTVYEIASNDGYLLQYFFKYNIKPIGIEPSEGTAQVAVSKGIKTIMRFFGSALAKELMDSDGLADLIIGNNVLAHVPDIGDFVQGMKLLLKQNGSITLEFPHILNLIRYNQFDTVYHEHFSYLSIVALNTIFGDRGLKIYKIDKLNTHGGSLRIYATHKENDIPIDPSVQEIISEECLFGLDSIEKYREFNGRVIRHKMDILETLIGIKREGKTIVGYGAAAKGNVLLNYCGVGTEMIDYTVDLSPHKQGLMCPGSLIPICHPDKIKETKPDYVLVVPWNIKEEIMTQLNYIRDWGGRFIVLIPQITII